MNVLYEDKKEKISALTVYQRAAASVNPDRKTGLEMSQRFLVFLV